MPPLTRARRTGPPNARDVASGLANEQPPVGVALPAISLRGVSKSYDLGRGRELRALDDIGMDVAAGGFTALIGASGCGKSTILRIIAGLEEPTAGTVLLEGAPPSQLVSGHRLGVAFQEHALLPWLSVKGNISLPFRAVGRAVDHDRVRDLIALVGLRGFENARPRQLSGGMRQRAAIARALALDPEILLLDEPFGALDAVTRRRLNIELRRIWEDRQITTILVTHDVAEAAFLADRVIVLSSRPGRIAAEETIPLPVGRDPGVTLDAAFHQLTDNLSQLLDGAAGEE